MLCGERFGERGGDRADERVAAPASSSPARPVASNTIWRASPRRRCRSPPALARPLAPTTAPGGVRCRGPLRAARGRDVERILAPPRSDRAPSAAVKHSIFPFLNLGTCSLENRSELQQTRATARGDERAESGRESQRSTRSRSLLAALLEQEEALQESWRRGWRNLGQRRGRGFWERGGAAGGT